MWITVIAVLFFPYLTLFDHKFTIMILSTTRNSRLVVNEDDLKWMANEKRVSILLDGSKKIVVVKPIVLRKLCHSKWCFDASSGFKELRKIEGQWALN